MNRCGVCALVFLLSVFVVSCEFWEGRDARQADVSSSKTGSRGGNVDGGSADNGDVKAAAVGAAEVTPITKLTLEETEKIKAFVEKTEPYTLDLAVVIHNKYIGFSKSIMAYSTCSEYDAACFGTVPSANRSKALEELEKSDLKKDFQKLSDLLKQAGGRDAGSLNGAIAEYERVLKEAKDANARIEEFDPSFTRKVSKEGKTRNLEYLRKVRAVEGTILRTMEVASLAYADAFVSLVSGMSSGQFKEAVDGFVKAAKKYVGANEGDEFTIIGYAIDIIISMEDLERLKSFVKAGKEGTEFVAAIDRLESVYKEAVSVEEDKEADDNNE
ncbi:hypothetical protein [Borrelia sp. P9F1]|uniref:hypothetical protein n=1 Tax=Borrelia sp. P9F1 TaxID=3058374 RepID=UPI002647DBE7|nr:hypothetical protein [Borrelia sp. P9F1]WKC58727.1 hypothetical protein QYZ68_05850 [Borrelia sp. P9F1]